jgi:hypothetical protein
MADLKTKPTKVNVKDFLDTVEPASKREDAYTILKLMEKITGEKAKMWGPSIVGFGQYHYKYESGHEGDMCVTGFSPRKANLVIYLIPGFNKYLAMIAKLGKYKSTGSCLYINNLSDIDLHVLEHLITQSVEDVKKKYSS